MGFRHHLRTAVLCSVAVFLSLFLDHYFFNQDRGRDQPTRSHPIANRDLLSQDVLPKNITSWHNHQALQRRQDSAWQTAVNKGDDLICLMRGTVEEAQKMVANSPKWAGKSVQSLFVDHTEMEKWGWEFVKTGQKPVDDFFDGHQLKETLSSLGLSSKLEHWSQESVEHWHDWNYKGKSGPVRFLFYSHFHDNRLLKIIGPSHRA
jgi:hypothetical protein